MKIVCLALLLGMQSLAFAAVDCPSIIYRKDMGSISALNVPTQKALELQEYNNNHVTKKYYPILLSREASQQFLTELLEHNPPEAFHPFALTSAAMDCDLETVQRYIEHGIHFHCYSAEGAGNFLGNLVHCTNHIGLEQRDRLLALVLQAGAKPNAGEEAPRTYPLTYANESCDATMVDFLLKYGC